jgi:hypothetical protein
VGQSRSVGYLDLKSGPPAVVDGVRLGLTPVLHFPVRSGTHTITFMHPDRGRRVAVTAVHAK